MRGVGMAYVITTMRRRGIKCDRTKSKYPNCNQCDLCIPLPNANDCMRRAAYTAYFCQYGVLFFSDNLYFPDPEPLVPSPAWIVASRLSSRRDMSSTTYHQYLSYSAQKRSCLLLASSSLLTVVNLVLSWFKRSSTTAVSSPEPSALVDEADCSRVRESGASS